ncbi:uncharacterized [Tachysurus ichikawai]
MPGDTITYTLKRDESQFFVFGELAMFISAITPFTFDSRYDLESVTSKGRISSCGRVPSAIIGIFIAKH